MHLLAPLAAGMAGAESGTVDVYARGTSTPITLYTDFEGTVTTANPATLDANGRAKLYVAEYARCLVKTPGGATVIDFVDGKDANAVELRSASIIGNAYSGGAAAAGNPISVEAAFNKLITSFGSTDFNVLLASVSVTLQSALGALWRARVFDVKQYGALGDGATNDLAAINAAASAANAAGGGIVFFPPGTYQISAGLTMFSTIEYVGVGSALSIIRAASDFVVFSGATMPTAVRKLGLAKSGSMSTWLVYSSTGRVLFAECAFASSNTGASYAFTINAAGKVTMVGCTMAVALGGGVVWQVTSGGEVTLNGCVATITATGVRTFSVSGNVGALSRLILTETTVDYSSIGSGGITSFGVDAGDYSVVKVVGCTFKPDPDATGETAAISATGSTECYIHESNNDFSGHYAMLASYLTQGPYRVAGYGPSATRFLGTREVASLAANNPNGSPITVHFAHVRTSIIRTTSGAGTRLIDAGSSMGVTGDRGSSNGSTAVLAVHNDTGASITYQWSNGFASTGSTFAVAANSVRTFSFVWISERVEWYLVSDAAGAETAE
jgi:hypothetical protein